MSTLANSYPINNTVEAMASVDDWTDRIGLQSRWSNAAKGWQVAVEWRQTPCGAGAYAAEDIPTGTLLRVGRKGVNLVEFRGVADAERFCAAAGAPGTDDPAYRSRLEYLSDYLYGFNPQAHEDAYAIAGTQPESDAPLFLCMWFPGNAINHSTRPNIVYRPAEGGTDVGINLVALRDIAQGDELLDDYRRHGRAPEWLLRFARHHGLTLNFAECNTFVTDPAAPEGPHAPRGTRLR